MGRLGKRIVLELDSGDRIVLEPRMTGLVLLADPPDAATCAWSSTSPAGAAAELLFWDQRGLGVARLVSPREFDRHYGPDRLGPDALEISAAVLRERLEASRRAIKVALLDQRAVAGIGNLYASEILHRAGIHPALPCRRLRPAQWAALHAAIQEVLRAAIRHQGSTLRDGTYRIARNQPGNYQLCHLGLSAGRPALPALRPRPKSCGSCNASDPPFFAPPARPSGAGIDVRRKSG